MQAPIILYGSAVQDARNILKSAQISTMVEVLRSALFSSTASQSSYFFSASAFANTFKTWLTGLAPADPPKAAKEALDNAIMRLNQFDSADTIYDLFAIGDALRYAGEYIENLGKDNPLNEFRDGLRPQPAFNKQTNRARVSIQDFPLSGWPDLGIFKNTLMDRSVVAYMERYYGPYIGADISGTTTDALAVLAYYWKDKFSEPNLVEGAKAAIKQGDELIPIATMVLQYHHTLMETGLALSLASKSMEGQPSDAALQSFNFYDFSTLTNNSTVSAVKAVTDNGNATLGKDLAGCGLVILRDLTDIDGSPFADVEIAALIPKPATSKVFNLAKAYPAFSQTRQRQMMSSTGYHYDDRPPSLAAIASQYLQELGFGDNADLASEAFNKLIKMNSLELKQANSDGDLKTYSDLGDALKAINAAGGQVQGAQAVQMVQPQLQSSQQNNAANGNQAASQTSTAPTDDLVNGVNPKTLKAALELMALARQ